jgi:hypothetical protein
MATAAAAAVLDSCDWSCEDATLNTVLGRKRHRPVYEMLWEAFKQRAGPIGCEVVKDTFEIDGPSLVLDLGIGKPVIACL